MVAAGHPETAAAACAVLAEGGNAVDAALAGLLAACVVEPVLASLGGGGFLAACPGAGGRPKRTVVYDLFVQTPRQNRAGGEADLREIVADFGPARQAFHIGLGTIATPGVVKGLFAASRDLGRMPVRRLVEPAVALARGGVPVDAMQAYVLRVVRAIVEADPSMRALFASPGHPGETTREGERLRLPDLADALEILAIEGDELFYRGEMAALLAHDCAARGGHLDRADLESYRVERRAPLTLLLGDAVAQLNPPPSSGGILVGFGLALWQALGRLDGSFGSVAHLRRLVAVMRATGRARIEERLHDGPRSSGDTPLDPALISRWRDEVAGAPPVGRGTTQISVVDAAGGVASLTVSNGEGSAYVLPGTGIILNNMLGEADLLPDGIAAWRRDCRLSSMMTPTIVRDDAGAVTALGSGGSSRIRTAILQTLLNLQIFGMSPEEAVNAPRLHWEEAAQRGEPATLSVEPGFAEEAVAAAAEGTQLAAWPAQNLFFGGVHTVRRSASGAFEGAGDPRRGGIARLA
ncbi:MAG: gamma-glutamyltransferase [Rhodospirillales bacterium]